MWSEIMKKKNSAQPQIEDICQEMFIWSTQLQTYSNNKNLSTIGFFLHIQIVSKRQHKKICSVWVDYFWQKVGFGLCDSTSLYGWSGQGNKWLHRCTYLSEKMMKIRTIFWSILILSFGTFEEQHWWCLGKYGLESFRHFQPIDST